MTTVTSESASLWTTAPDCVPHRPGGSIHTRGHRPVLRNHHPPSHHDRATPYGFIAPSFPQAGANITWISITFGLVGGIVTPIGGKLSDLIGKKTVMLAERRHFLIGTVICLVTSNWPLFLVGRALEAVAIVAPTIAYGLVRDLFPRRLVPIGIGMISTGFGLSALAAPLLSGWLLNHFSWRSMFRVHDHLHSDPDTAVHDACAGDKVRIRQSLDWAGCILLGFGVASSCSTSASGPRGAGAVPGACSPSPWARRCSWRSSSSSGVSRKPIVDLGLLLNRKVSLVLVCGLLLGSVVGMGYSISYLLGVPDQSTAHRHDPPAGPAQRLSATSPPTPP